MVPVSNAAIKFFNANSDCFQRSFCYIDFIPHDTVKYQTSTSMPFTFCRRIFKVAMLHSTQQYNNINFFFFASLLCRYANTFCLAWWTLKGIWTQTRKKQLKPSKLLSIFNAKVDRGEAKFGDWNWYYGTQICIVGTLCVVGTLVALAWCACIVSMTTRMEL